MATGETGAATVGTAWRAFFWLAAAYNFLIGGVGMLNPEAEPTNIVVSILVIGFGIVYAIVATHPLRFAPMLWAGLIAKVAVVATLAPEVQAGAMPAPAGFVLAGDGLFALGFLVFLIRHRGLEF